MTGIWQFIIVDSIFVRMLEILHNKKLERVLYILIWEDFQDILSIFVKSKLQNNVFGRIFFLLKYSKKNIYRALVMCQALS